MTLHSPIIRESIITLKNVQTRNEKPNPPARIHSSPTQNQTPQETPSFQNLHSRPRILNTQPATLSRTLRLTLLDAKLVLPLVGGGIPRHKRDAVRALVIRVGVERRGVAQQQIDADPVCRGVYTEAFPVGHVGGGAEDGGLAADGGVFVRAGTGVHVSQGGGLCGGGFPNGWLRGREKGKGKGEDVTIHG